MSKLIKILEQFLCLNKIWIYWDYPSNIRDRLNYSKSVLLKVFVLTCGGEHSAVVEDFAIFCSRCGFSPADSVWSCDSDGNAKLWKFAFCAAKSWPMVNPAKGFVAKIWDEVEANRGLCKCARGCGKAWLITMGSCTLKNNIFWILTFKLWNFEKHSLFLRLFDSEYSQICSKIRQNSEQTVVWFNVLLAIACFNPFSNCEITPISAGDDPIVEFPFGTYADGRKGWNRWSSKNSSYPDFKLKIAFWK